MTDATNGALLPCPFCGGEAEFLRPSNEHFSYVYCGQCGVETERFGSETQATNAWNRRQHTWVGEILMATYCDECAVDIGPVCDFCLHFDSDAFVCKRDGSFTTPGSGCDDFHCRKAPTDNVEGE